MDFWHGLFLAFPQFFIFVVITTYNENEKVYDMRRREEGGLGRVAGTTRRPGQKEKTGGAS